MRAAVSAIKDMVHKHLKTSSDIIADSRNLFSMEVRLLKTIGVGFLHAWLYAKPVKDMAMLCIEFRNNHIANDES